MVAAARFARPALTCGSRSREFPRPPPRARILACVTPRVPVRAPALVAAVLTLVVAAAAGLGALGRHGALLVQQCVSDGTAGAIGLRLALVRGDSSCPGGLALGGDGRQVIGVVVLVAVPVLLAHVVGALAGAGLLARARAGVGRALGVLTRWFVLPEPGDVPVASRVHPAVPSSFVVREALRAGEVLRRGPPVAVAA